MGGEVEGLLLIPPRNLSQIKEHTWGGRRQMARLCEACGSRRAVLNLEKSPRLGRRHRGRQASRREDRCVPEESGALRRAPRADTPSSAHE